MSTPAHFAMVENPAYAGRTPSIQQALCHDRSPFITVGCGCGELMHFHETQLDAIPLAVVELAMRCKGCRQTLLFTPGFFRKGFQDLRDQGWIE